jgi:hypothetical protein
MFNDVSYVSVVFAAIVGFFTGWLWYGPVFGKHWMAMMGYTKESMAQMKMKPITAMVLGFVTMLVMAYVLAGLASTLLLNSMAEALALAFWMWLGFVATVTMGSVLWEDRSWNLYLFNVAYYLVALGLMSVVVVLLG